MKIALILLIVSTICGPLLVIYTLVKKRIKRLRGKRLERYESERKRMNILHVSEYNIKLPLDEY